MTEFNQMLYARYHWQDLRWYCKSSFFCKFATELQPLIGARIQFLFNILRMYGQNLTKFCIHIIIDKIYVGIVNRHFSQICNRVTALDWRKNSVFVQYLENEWIEFNQILYSYYDWQDHRWYCKSSFFANLQQSNGPWFASEFIFVQYLENEWTEFNQFVCTLSLTRSSLGL